MTLNKDQFGPDWFGQNTLWEGSGEWLNADRQVRRNMATDLRFPEEAVGSMERSKATRADFHALEVIKPDILQTWDAPGSGAYSVMDNTVEYSVNEAGTQADEDTALYHELGHALHMGGRARGGTYTSSAYNPDPVQEGIADGTMDRFGEHRHGIRGSYRGSPEYTTDINDHSSRSVLTGGSSWGPSGRAHYEAARGLAGKGVMPDTFGFSYRSGSSAALSKTQGFQDLDLLPLHRMKISEGVDRDMDYDRATNRQQELFDSREYIGKKDDSWA